MSSYEDFNENTGNTNTTANFTGLDNGKYYQFRISAINSEGSGVVAVSDNSFCANNFESSEVGSLVTAETLDAVGKADIAAEPAIPGLPAAVVLLVVAEWIVGDPADDEVGSGFIGELAGQVQAVRPDLVIALVEIDAQDLADFSCGGHAIGFAIVRMAGDYQPRREGNTP